MIQKVIRAIKPSAPFLTHSPTRGKKIGVFTFEKALWPQREAPQPPGLGIPPYTQTQNDVFITLHTQREQARAGWGLVRTSRPDSRAVAGQSENRQLLGGAKSLEN